MHLRSLRKQTQKSIGRAGPGCPRSTTPSCESRLGMWLAAILSRTTSSRSASRACTMESSGRYWLVTEEISLQHSRMRHRQASISPLQGIMMTYMIFKMSYNQGTRKRLSR